MRKFVKNNNTNMYINLISIFVIFLLFIILSLVLILMATDAYKKMNIEVENTFNTTALVSYISNKAKSYDNTGDVISIENKDKTSMLRLENAKEKLVTYIYEKDNNIYENTIRKDDRFNSDSGQVLFKANKLSFEKCSDNLLKINVETIGKEKMYNYVNIITDALSSEK